MEPQHLPVAPLPAFSVAGISGQYQTPETNSNAAGFSIVETIAARKKALTVAELATLLNVGKRSVYDWIEAGKLQAYRISGVMRLDPKTTAAWLRGRLTN